MSSFRRSTGPLGPSLPSIPLSRRAWKILCGLGAYVAAPHTENRCLSHHVQGGSMHMFSAKNNFLGGYAFIGEGIPIGLGAAFQSKYKQDVLGEGKDYAVTASFFGDGTCNVGQFYECLNMAALYKLPHIFVVENNKWAIGMSHPRATATTAGDSEPYIYKKGPAFGMPGILVDGMDVLKVNMPWWLQCRAGAPILNICVILSHPKRPPSHAQRSPPPCKGPHPMHSSFNPPSMRTFAPPMHASSSCALSTPLPTPCTGA